MSSTPFHVAEIFDGIDDRHGSQARCMMTLPARWAFGFSDDHQQNTNVYWFTDVSLLMYDVDCFLLGIKLLLLSNGNIFRVTGHLRGEFTGEFPSQRPVTRRFEFSLICVWINGWVNNHEAGDLRRYRGHYDVIVMDYECSCWFPCFCEIKVRKI